MERLTSKRRLLKLVWYLNISLKVGSATQRTTLVFLFLTLHLLSPSLRYSLIYQSEIYIYTLCTVAHIQINGDILVVCPIIVLNIYLGLWHHE